MGTATRKRTDTRTRFARNMLRFREALGLSQESFADKIGFHRTYISAVERGKRNVSLDNIDKIAKALRIDPIELIKDC